MKHAVLVLCMVGLAAGAFADLQNVQVGGSLVMMGEYYRNHNTPGDGLRWNGFDLFGRPIGTDANDVYSWFGGDSHGKAWKWVTQWTRLNVSADFTDNVRAFIEFDSVDMWGEDFRSNYLTGIDGRANTVDDVEVYQSYVEVNEAFGAPVRLRLGRQELSFGSEWLVGNNDCATAPTYGQSFDGVRVTYAAEPFTVDAWWTKLAERSPLEQDGDTDFMGVYGSFEGIEDITLDAYWLWLRDVSAVADTYYLSPLDEWIEDCVDVDDYGRTNLHTIGLRGAGTLGAFDFDAEAAYQFGDAAHAGGLFVPLIYGDDGAEYDAWGVNVEAGYTFDVAWQPRVFLAYAFLQGEDNRELSFGEWLLAQVNPFYQGQASTSFNRLFSDKYYSLSLDIGDFSNLHVFKAGVSATPTEKLELSLDVSHYMVDEPFDAPIHWDLGRFMDNYRWRLPLFPDLSFWTDENDDDLGWELALEGSYQYSEDLYFAAGWSHLFPGEGLEDGSFVGSYGLDFIGGSDDADADYFYFETGISFGGGGDE